MSPGVVVAILMLSFSAVGAVAATPPAAAGISGSIIIAGDGPELGTIEQLARAFEKAHLGTVVELKWHPYSNPINLVKSGQAHVAVTGRPDETLAALPIAWDGIAIVVYTGNRVREMTSGQVAALFSGTITRWADLSGTDSTIRVINRPENQHIRQSFEQALGIVGRIPVSAQTIRSDQRTISTVAGDVSAVAYTSLRPALDAVKYGVDISLLVIDGVEAAEETVKDGRYKLRRPVLLLSRQEPNAVLDAFAAFARSRAGQKIVAEAFTPYYPDAEAPQ